MKNTYRNFWQNIKKEKLLSASNILTMTLTFLVMGFLVHISILLHTAIKTLQNQAQVNLFFKDSFAEAQILEFKSLLEKDERILSVTYISKEEAYKIFTEENADNPEYVSNATPSILPASLVITAKNVNNLEVLADEGRQNDFVESVSFYKDVIERFKLWTAVVYVVGGVLLTVFIFISYSIILATLRGTIHSRGQEYEILKLVGASDSYIKSPLVYQGVFYGLMSAVVAGFIISIMSSFFMLSGMFFDKTSFVYFGGIKVNPILFVLFVNLILIASGSVLGYLGSLTAVKKYLKY